VLGQNIKRFFDKTQEISSIIFRDLKSGNQSNIDKYSLQNIQKGLVGHDNVSNRHSGLIHHAESSDNSSISAETNATISRKILLKVFRIFNLSSISTISNKLILIASIFIIIIMLLVYLAEKKSTYFDNFFM
jgi:hypothetical protein